MSSRTASQKQPRRRIVVASSIFLASLTAVSGAFAGTAMADGTETLGVPSVAIASGTGFVIAGAGMVDQPGTITVDVPAGAAIVQVLAYWEGQSSSAGAGFDDTISLNGTPVTGVLIGGPTKFFTTPADGEFWSSTYRADITALGLVGAGTTILSASAMTFDQKNDGVGIAVLLDDGGPKSELSIRDGNDLAFRDFASPLDATVLQTVTFAPATVARTGSIGLFASSVVGEEVPGLRPNVVEVTVGATTTAYGNLLNSVDGEEWDSVRLDVTIPAGVTSLSVRLVSDDPADPDIGNLPASLAWSAALVSIPPPPDPGIQIVKRINGDDANTAPGVVVAAGSTMAITFEVTNTGDVPLTDVTVTDDKVAASAIACDGPGSDNVKDGTVVPGASFTCTASFPAPAAGVQHTNVGTVVGTPPSGPPVTDNDPANAAVPSILIVKRINGDDANIAPGVVVAAGSTMAITFEVTNTGIVPLTNVTVTDDKVAASAIACDGPGSDNVKDGTVAAGASFTCTASFPAPAAGVQHTNVGTVVATPPSGPPVTDNDPANAAVPSIRIVKLINGDDANSAPGVTVAAGSTMTILYQVTNAGIVPLTNVTVTDDKVAASAIACDGPGSDNVKDGTVAPGAVFTCTASFPAPAAGVQHTNVGTVVGTPPSGPPVTDDDPANANTPAPGAPAIEIVKFVNGFDADVAPGVTVPAASTLSFTYRVTNIGAVTLTAVTVTDNRGVAVTCPKTVLVPAESMICTASGPAPASGQYTNIGTTRGTPPTGPPVTDDNPANAFVPTPGIDITKFVNGADADNPPGIQLPVGNPVTWTYEVVNTGNVDLINVVVTDDKGVSVNCGGGSNVIPLLRVAQKVVCAASGTAVTGLYTNIGRAVGTPNPPLLPGQPPIPTPPVSDTNPANYTGVPTVVVLPPPPPELPPGDLPPTGSTTANGMTLAATLMIIGALLVASTRRRRPQARADS